VARQEAVSDAIQRALGFVLRQQLPNGAWAIFRYEGDAHLVEPRELSSCAALEALANAAEDEVLGDEFAIRIATAVEAFVAFCADAMSRDGDGSFWSEGFAKEGRGRNDAVFATSLAVRALLAASRALQAINDSNHADLVTTIEDCILGGLSHIDRYWEPDPEKFAITTFRVPTWRGPAATDFTWELPLDAFVASVLMRSATASHSRLGNDCWSKIGAVIIGSLGYERHGHWFDYLMQRNEGEERAITANTRYQVECLGTYLEYLADGISPSPA
jgi:hypothetical protein